MYQVYIYNLKKQLCIDRCVCVCVCECVRVCVCACVHVYVYLHQLCMYPVNILHVIYLAYWDGS